MTSLLGVWKNSAGLTRKKKKQVGIRGTPLSTHKSQELAKQRIRNLRKDPRTKGARFGISRSPGGAFTVRKRKK